MQGIVVPGILVTTGNEHGRDLLGVDALGIGKGHQALFCFDVAVLLLEVLPVILLEKIVDTLVQDGAFVATRLAENEDSVWL